MSCYFRHLKDIFTEAGIEVTTSNKKEIDQAIHQFAGINYKDCPGTWEKLKREIIDDKKKRQDFIARLRSTIK